MKFEIANGNTQEEREEPVVLALKAEGDGVYLRGKRGDSGWRFLLYISPDGTFRRVGAVGAGLGFKLDARDKVVETE